MDTAEGRGENRGTKEELKPESVCQSKLNARSWTSISSTQWIVKHNACGVYVISSTGSTHISQMNSKKKMLSHLFGQRTVQPAYELGPPFLRKVNGHIVDRSPRQSDADADQRINGVPIQWHDDQEEAAQAVDKREEEGQLWREKSHTRS